MVPKGKRPLSVTHPELANEAFGWDPSNITFGSGKKVKWKCREGHIWECSPNRRTSGSNAKCPVCINRVILLGFNDLATTRPDLAKETSKAIARSVWSGSLKKIGWKCSAGHMWEATPYSRSVQKCNCPICGNKKVVPGVNDLQTTNPTVAKEADGWDPTTVTSGSGKRLAWKCKKGHTWSASPGSRSYYESSCPFCIGHRIIKDETDLKTLFPEIAMEADGWDPTSVAPSSREKLKWRCGLGHGYLMAVANRARLKQNCPVCAGKRVISGFNDLATTNPEIAEQAFGWDSSTVVAGSKKKRSWKCQLGHVWEAAILSRVYGNGCGICASRILLVGFNDLKSRFPNIAAQADGWNPEEKMSGSSERLMWKCAKGHDWESSIVNRTFNKNGCPICSNHKLLTGSNDLATVYPELAEQAHGWDPSLVVSGGKQKLSWECPLGHVWKSMIASRISQKTSCLVCGGKQVLAGFNDVETLLPDLALEAVGWDPTKYTLGSGVKVKWRCSKGHLWSAVISSRTSGGQGCPSCAVSGFDPNKDGYFYFITHLIWEMYQIGITNIPDDRLGRHEKLGWEILELRGPMDGHLTQQWETAILQMLKAKGADLSNSKIAGKFDGYSEAWSQSTFPVESIKELMRLTEDYEVDIERERKG